MQNRPELATARAQAAAAQSQIRVARSALSSGAGVHRDGREQRLERLDLLRATRIRSTSACRCRCSPASRTSTTLRRRQEQYQAALARTEATKQQIIQQVFTAYYTLRTSTHRVRTSRDLLASATQSEAVARERYREGVGSIVDLLDRAERARQRARAVGGRALAVAHGARAARARRRRAQRARRHVVLAAHAGARCEAGSMSMSWIHESHGRRRRSGASRRCSRSRRRARSRAEQKSPPVPVKLAPVDDDLGAAHDRRERRRRAAADRRRSGAGRRHARRSELQRGRRRPGGPGAVPLDRATVRGGAAAGAKRRLRATKRRRRTRSATPSGTRRSSRRTTSRSRRPIRRLSTAAAAQATVQADRAAVDNARLNLNYTTIRAPICGTHRPPARASGQSREAERAIRSS